MLDLNAKHRMLFFSHNIWREISSYLEPAEIRNLKLLCKAFNNSFTALELEGIWLPFLNRLQVIDPSISLQFSKGPIQLHFLTCLQKINTQQQNEISYFQHQLEESSDSLQAVIVAQKLQEIAEIDNPAMTLHKIEKRHRTLNDLNADLIEIAIQEQLPDDNALDSLNLNGTDFAVTRLPACIFKDPQYKEVWQNLKSLNCENQEIYMVSKEIRMCRSLQFLYLSNNNLDALPGEITECRKLLSLTCDNNKLKFLPLHLNLLEDVQTLSFVGNGLTSLPSIPESCSVLFVARNCLHELSEELEEQFGAEWSEITLQNQKKRALPIILDDEPTDKKVKVSTHISLFFSGLYNKVTSFFFSSSHVEPTHTTENQSDEESDGSYAPSQTESDEEIVISSDSEEENQKKEIIVISSESEKESKSEECDEECVTASSKQSNANNASVLKDSYAKRRKI